MKEREIIDKNWEEVKRFLNQFTPKDKKIKDNQKHDVITLVSIINRMIYKSKIEKNLKLAKDFLKSAKENLELSKAAYEQKFYSSAGFNLTLATEKLVKAYGLAFFGLNKKELKWKIKHDSPLTFTIIMKKEPFKSYLSLMESFYPFFLNKKPNELENFVKNKNVEILKAKEQEINFILDTYQKIENVFNDKTNKKIKVLIDSAFSILPKNQQKINIKIEFFQKLVISFTLLGAVSFIIFPHYFTSNYPDSKKMKYEGYNENLGIIKTFWRITEILKKCNESLDNYLKSKID